MGLIGIQGNSESAINRKLLLYASQHLPALIIDCANAANPHSLYPTVPFEHMNRMFVIELELLYKFRDVLLRIPGMAKKLRVQCIVITTSDHLFNYQDKEENQNIFRHSWELMQSIGEKHTIVVGIRKGSLHEPFAQKYCHRLGVLDGTYRNEPAHDGRHHHERTQFLRESA